MVYCVSTARKQVMAAIVNTRAGNSSITSDPSQTASGRHKNVTVETADRSGTTSARNVFPARVASIAPVGPYLKVKLDCGFPLVASVTAESFATLGLARGAAVFASFKATAIHVIRKTEPGPAARA